MDPNQNTNPQPTQPEPVGLVNPTPVQEPAQVVAPVASVPMSVDPALPTVDPVQALPAMPAPVAIQEPVQTPAPEMVTTTPVAPIVGAPIATPDTNQGSEQGGVPPIV